MTDDNEALAAKLRDLESKLDEKSSGPSSGLQKFMAYPGCLLPILILLLIVILILGLVLLSGGGDDDSTADEPEVTLSADEIFRLQTNCFDNGLNYDDQGNCLDASGAIVAAPAAVTTTIAGGAAPADPAPPPVPPTTTAGAPVPPTTTAGAPVPPTTTAGAPVPPTTTAGAPVPPTTTAGAPVPPTTTAATAAPTTTAAPGLTFGQTGTEWVVSLSPPPPVGKTVQQCQDEDPRSSECNRYFDLPKSVTIKFGVFDGVVDGEGRNPFIEKEIDVSGQMTFGQTTLINANLLNRDTIENIYEFAGTAGSGCSFSGTYRYLRASGPDPNGDIGGSQSAIFVEPGRFSMEYRGNDCPN